MLAAITLKDKSGKPVHYKNCKFTNEQWAALRGDWLSYINNGTPKGGAYICTSNEMFAEDEPMELLLRFDEVAAIG